MGRRARLSTAAILCVAIAGCAGYLKPDEPKRGLEFTESLQSFSASNGFEVFVLPDPTSEVVHLELRYDVGAANDPVGKSGLAHLVEHMMFQTRITARGERVSVMSEMSRVGLGVNAYTNFDSTHYISRARPEHLDALFALEMNRLASGCSTWTEEMFVREREVVRNEIRERYSTPAGDFTRMIHEAAYPAGHPYRRTIGGTDESIAQIALSDACAFVAQYYRPDRVKLFVVGNVELSRVRALAGRWFRGFAKQANQPIRPIPKFAPSKRTVVKRELDIDHPRMFVTFPLPEKGSQQSRLVEMSFGALDRRLSQFASRYKWGSNVNVFKAGGAHAPLLVVTARLRRSSDFDTAVEAVWKSIKWVKRSMARKGERVHRSRRWLYRREYRKERILADYERQADRGSLYADFVQFDRQPLFVAGRLKELDKVGPQQVRAAVEKALRPGRATVLLVTPRDGARSYRAGDATYSPKTHGDAYWRVTVDLAEADRPVPLPQQRPRSLKIYKSTLGNGLKVVLWPHGTLPLVHGRLVLSIGRADEPHDKAGLASAAGGIVDYDATYFGARDLATEAHKLVGRLSSDLRVHASYNIDDWRDRQLRNLDKKRRRERSRYLEAFRGALYGPNHPYARGRLTKASVRRINGDTLAAFARKYHRAGNATLIVTGRFDPALIKKWVVYHFNHIERGTSRSKRVPPARNVVRNAIVTGFADGDSPVMEIDVGFSAPSGIDRSYAARLVLQDVLNGQLRALREELAVTYGMNASYTPRPGPGEWRIRGKVDAARSKEALEAVNRLFEKMTTDPKSYLGDFVLARRKLVEKLLSDSSSPVSVAHRLSFIAAFSLQDDFFDKLLHDVAHLKVSQVDKLIRSELAPRRRVVGLFGGRAAVSAAAAGR